MSFNVKRKFFASTNRVNSVDFHPTLPWFLTGLYDGTVEIYNLESGTVIHTFKVSDNIVLCVKFIARKNWFVTSSLDGQFRVFDYNTYEEVVAFKAHASYIRCLAVHPTTSIVLSCSDDETIKVWDWDKQWRNIQTYQADSCVNHITFNPQESKLFASCTLNGTIQMWSIGSPVPKLTIRVHNRNITSVGFYPGGGKPYLVIADYNNTVQVWDYLSKTCVRTILAHTDAVYFSAFHPDLPIIISGSLDGTIKIWDSTTYEIRHTLNYGLGWPWCLALRQDTNEVAVGFEFGVLTFTLDHREPELSMDDTGKLIYAWKHKVSSANIRNLYPTTTTSSPDGAQIPLEIEKDLGSIKAFAPVLLPSPNGRFMTAIDNGKYVIYSTLGWRKKIVGTGISFAWAPDSSTYAVLESKTEWTVYRDFQVRSHGGLRQVKDHWRLGVEELCTGPVLGTRGPGYVIFWDWETGKMVKRIGVDAQDIYWSNNGTHLMVASSFTCDIFYFDLGDYQKPRLSSSYGEINGLFTPLFTLPDTVRSAKWVGNCLLYTTPTRLCYSIISTISPSEGREELESFTISLIDNKLSLLGYIPAHEKVYVAGKDIKVYGFELSSAVVEFQTAVLSGNVGAAKELLKNMPKEQFDKIVKFLEGRGMKELVRSIGTDPYQQCVTLVMELIVTKATNKLIAELRGNEAQGMTDFLSKIINDKGTLTQRERKHTLHLLSKLAKSAQVFPQCLELEGVECNLMDPITAGGYGFIYKGEHEGISICVKAVRVDSRGVDRKKMRAHASELSIWANLFHPNIIPFLGIYASKEKVSRVCIVSPWMDNGDLFDYLKTVPDTPRKPLVRDVISGLQYLHDLDVVHADLKARNVLVSQSGRAMLADFGVSRLSMTQTMTSTNVSAGTAYWMAPELLLEDEPPNPNRETDIWAFACTCYEIITGMIPFGQYRNPPQLMGAFMRGKIVPLEPQEPVIGWDEDVWSVAARCWKSDPSSRPSAHELLDMINSFNFKDDRSSDPEPQRSRSYDEIDYDRILGTLNEIRRLAVT